MSVPEPFLIDELLKIRGTVVNKATGQPFKPRVFFTASPESQAAPKVSF